MPLFNVKHVQMLPGLFFFDQVLTKSSPSRLHLTSRKWNSYISNNTNDHTIHRCHSQSHYHCIVWYCCFIFLIVTEYKQKRHQNKNRRAFYVSFVIQVQCVGFGIPVLFFSILVSFFFRFTLPFARCECKTNLLIIRINMTWKRCKMAWKR